MESFIDAVLENYRQEHCNVLFKFTTKFTEKSRPVVFDSFLCSDRSRCLQKTQLFAIQAVCVRFIMSLQRAEYRLHHDDSMNCLIIEVKKNFVVSRILGFII